MTGKMTKRVIWPLLAVWAACGGGFERGAPISDANEIARSLRESTGPPSPTRVVFEWEYADDRGNFRGEGAARVNPPDRFRLDLFSTGDQPMQATLLEGELIVRGDLDGVQLPPSVFLYAMAGVFRPDTREPVAGFESRDYRVLEFAGESGTSRYFYVLGGRLIRVEERRGNRLERRIELEWGEDTTWPLEARYRDDTTPNAVRWELLSTNPRQDPWDASIYALPKDR